jgi:transposase
MEEIRRHDISDALWDKLEGLLPGRQGRQGREARDNRKFINGVFWILRTGSPWRDLPSAYGGWKNVHRRFCRWRDNRIWELLLETLVAEPKLEWLLIDASYIKVHMHATGAKGGNQGMGRSKGGSTQNYIWPWMRMVCPSDALLQTASRLSKAEELIDGINAGGLVADKGYDSDDIVIKAENRGMKVVIPPRKNRNFQREYDKQVYKTRRLVENAFLLLKRWRGIATRYAKNTASFLAAIHIRCLALWAL